MAFTNDQVIKAFLEKKSYHSKNLHSDGSELKSYEMTIAKWTDEVLVILDGQMPSITTTTHRNTVMRKATNYSLRMNF